MRDVSKDRTNSRPKNVAHSPDSAHVRHVFPAELLKVLSGRIPIPFWAKLEGDLSTWIVHLHQLSDTSVMSQNLDLTKDVVGEFLSVLNEFAASRAPSHQKSGVFKRIHDAGRETEVLLERAYKSGNRAEYDSLFAALTSQVVDASRLPIGPIPPFFMTPSGLSQLLRALRASLRCMALLREPPLVVISRASKGDRRAVLDLIKMDKLFLSDPCCQETIRQASLNDDVRFLNQIQGALKYKCKLGRRELLRIYLFVLIACEKLGVPIPELPQLWKKLDPHGREYGSLAAFERDFQRRRRELSKLLEGPNITAQAPDSEKSASSRETERSLPT